VDVDIQFKGFLDRNWHSVTNFKKIDFCKVVEGPPALLKDAWKMVLTNLNQVGLNLHNCPYDVWGQIFFKQNNSYYVLNNFSVSKSLKINSTAGFVEETDKTDDRLKTWHLSKDIFPNGLYKFRITVSNARDANLLTVSFLVEQKRHMNDDQF
jgi:hypothetical protein